MNKTNIFYSFPFYLLTFSSFLLFAAPAHSQSVQFDQGAWEEVLSRSKKEGKIIFVDVYTAWCGPCKKMDKEVFSKKKVADYFNEHFVNFKIDADQEEGRAFKAKYDVRGYPTFLFIREDSSTMWKEAGYLEMEILLEIGKTVMLLKEDRELSVMSKEYRNGKRNKDFLIRYMQLRKERLKADNSDVLTQFIAQLDSSEQLQPEYLKVIADYFSQANTRAFELMLEHQELFIEEELLTLDAPYLEAIEKQQRQLEQLPAGQAFNASPDVLKKAIIRQCLEERMDNALNNSMGLAAKVKNNALFDSLLVLHLRFNEQAKRRNIKQRNDQLKVRFYRQTEQPALYAAAAEEYINTFILDRPVSVIPDKDSLRKHTAEWYLNEPSLSEVLGKKEAQNLQYLQKQSRKLSQRTNARQLVQTAKDFSDFFEEENQLLKAVAWVEQAILIYEEPLHYLTYAALIDQLGDRSLALKLIDKGLQLCGAGGDQQVSVSAATSKKEARELQHFREKLSESK